MALSKRDAGQVLKALFDDDTQSLRTTVVNIVDDAKGVTEISINATDDSIKLGNGSGNFLTVNSDGSINANIISTEPVSYSNVNQYNEITNVAIGATENVINYIVPLSGIFYLKKISFSGDSISEFDLLINGSSNAKQRLYYTKFNSIFDYSDNVIPGYKLAPGTSIVLNVTNYSLQSPGNFNATLEGIIST